MTIAIAVACFAAGAVVTVVVLFIRATAAIVILSSDP